MIVLKYVWLLCTWLTLVAAAPHAPGHSRNKRQSEQIRLDFTLFSNSTTDCSAGLSNQGVSVAVSYRTFTDQGSSEWTPGGQIFRTPDTLCKALILGSAVLDSRVRVEIGKYTITILYYRGLHKACNKHYGG